MKFLNTLSLVIFVSFNAFAATQAVTQITDLKAHESEVKAIATKYSQLVKTQYDRLVTESKNLKKEVDNFVKNPTAANMDAAKSAWKKLRDVYSPTESYRFYGGPIDAPEVGPEALMNAWPIDESYIDYVKDQPGAGIINRADQFPKIDKETLIALNEKDGERNVSTGYHAVEFLLWGQDLNTSSAGQRTYEDYVKGKSPTAERRGQYLLAVTDLLVEHAQNLADAWKPDAAYPKAFAAEKPDEILRRILTGMTSLAADEMSGERMTVSLEKQDQENEQDCFSDYTLNDLMSNQKGIMDIYAQTGVKQLFAKLDPKTEKKIEAQMKKTMGALKAIPTPFDKVIGNKKVSAEKKKVQKSIDSLQLQAKLISQVADKVGVHLNVQ